MMKFISGLNLYISICKNFSLEGFFPSSFEFPLKSVYTISFSFKYPFADPETCDWMVVASLWGKRFSVPLPLEILLVKGFTNFITAGRAVSVDHTMASHLRMQRSIQKLGEIAALAAAQSIKTGLPLRKINLDLLEAEVRKSGTLDETCLIPNEEPSDPAALRALLEGEAPGEAIWVTGHEPEKYAGLLHEMLRNGTEHARRNAALALGLAGDPAARPILREIVASRDDFLPKMTKNPRQNRSRYLAAIHLLGRFGNPDDLRFLMELLESFPEDEQVFSHALRSVLALGDLLPEQREMIRKRLDEIFHDSRFHYRLLMKNSSSTGEQVFHELNSDLRAMAEKHFRRWTADRGDVA